MVFKKVNKIFKYYDFKLKIYKIYKINQNII